MNYAPIWATPELSKRAAAAGLSHVTRVDKTKSLTEEDFIALSGLMQALKDAKKSVAPCGDSVKRSAQGSP